MADDPAEEDAVLGWDAADYPELGKTFQHQEALHTAYATRKAINDQLAAAAAPRLHQSPRTQTSQHPSVS
jgi:hypothetical protein